MDKDTINAMIELTEMITKNHEITAEAVASVTRYRDNEMELIESQQREFIALSNLNELVNVVREKVGISKFQEISDEYNRRVIAYAQSAKIEDFRHNLLTNYDHYFEESKNAEHNT